MPNGFEITKVLADKSVPLFDASSLWWGLGLALISIMVSVLSWRTMKGIFQPEQRTRAILLWVINAGIFIIALIMLTKAFPRVSPALVLGVFFVLTLAVAGGTTVAKKKADEGGSGGKDDKKSQR